MYAVTVQDHMLIAHSLTGAVFGPAQQLHGATYVIEATFRAEELDADGIVVDIGRAGEVLAGIARGFSHRNLDDDPSLAGVNTTTEVLCRVIADRLAAALATGDLGPANVTEIEVTLRESPVAWASYRRTT